MYTMRRSTVSDIPRERELWRMSFGDDWEYIDTYYDHTHDPDWCVVLEDEDGVVQTMLIGFPVQQTLPDGAQIPAIYYYALGTDPAVRGRGYGRALFRYAEKKGIDTSKRADLNAFPDANKVSSYAKDALAWANAEGLVKGSNENGKDYLAPAASATRAQVATILARYAQNIVK